MCLHHLPFLKGQCKKVNKHWTFRLLGTSLRFSSFAKTAERWTKIWLIDYILFCSCYLAKMPRDPYAFPRFENDNDFSSSSQLQVYNIIWFFSFSFLGRGSYIKLFTVSWLSQRFPLPIYALLYQERNNQKKSLGLSTTTDGGAP